jgi:GT2 family glycosyltransferase
MELATFFVEGMVISGGAVYYHLSGHSKRKPNIFNYLHRNANKLRFFVTKNAPANSMLSKSFSGSLLKTLNSRGVIP